jgi:hypothetical protein
MTAAFRNLSVSELAISVVGGLGWLSGRTLDFAQSLASIFNRPDAGNPAKEIESMKGTSPSRNNNLRRNKANECFLCVEMPPSFGTKYRNTHHTTYRKPGKPVLRMRRQAPEYKRGGKETALELAPSKTLWERKPYASGNRTKHTSTKPNSRQAALPRTEDVALECRTVNL